MGLTPLFACFKISAERTCSKQLSKCQATSFICYWPSWGSALPLVLNQRISTRAFYISSTTPPTFRLCFLLIRWKVQSLKFALLHHVDSIKIQEIGRLRQRAGLWIHSWFLQSKKELARHQPQFSLRCQGRNRWELIFNVVWDSTGLTRYQKMPADEVAVKFSYGLLAVFSWWPNLQIYTQNTSWMTFRKLAQPTLINLCCFWFLYICLHSMLFLFGSQDPQWQRLNSCFQYEALDRHSSKLFLPFKTGRSGWRPWFILSLRWVDRLINFFSNVWLIIEGFLVSNFHLAGHQFPFVFHRFSCILYRHIPFYWHFAQRKVFCIAVFIQKKTEAQDENISIF